MSPAIERTESPPGSFFTIRALLLGCAACGLIGLAGPYWCFYLMSSSLFADYHLAGAIFGLLVLVLIFNVALARLWRRLRLGGGELRYVTAMTLTSGSIVTSGLIAYLIPGMTAPFYHATEANQMRANLWPALPEWLFPLDPNGGTVAIQKFWAGLGRGEPVPWGPWIGPLAAWAVLVLAMFACMIALMSIMRKQWVDYEHLSYPIAQVPAELCAAAERPGAVSSILRSRAFWIAVGLALLLDTSTGLHNYVGVFPVLQLKHTVSGLGPMALSINLGPTVLALTFLIPNRVAFSVWSMALGSWVLRSFIRTYNFGMQEWMLYGVVGHPELQHVAMGSMIVFALGSLWLARRHLKRVLLCAAGLLPGYDEGEPTSYRISLLFALGGAAVVVAWFVAIGMNVFWAVLLFAVTLVVYYSMARVIAQCGLPAINSPVVPSPWIASTFGGRLLGRENVIGLGANLMWHADLRNSPFSGAGHGLYLTGRRSRGLFWAMLLGLLITFAVASLFTVWLGYQHGASSMHDWYIRLSSRLTWHWTSAMSTGDADPNRAGMLWAVAGALIMAALMVAHRTFFWWPIHPVGFLTNGAFLVTAFWFSIFMAWLIKVLLVYLGGQRAYRTGRRFFIGYLVGHIAAGGAWAIVDTLTETTGNVVFGL